MNEPTGTWKVKLLQFSWPQVQRLGHNYFLRVQVLNLEQKAIPNLTLAIKGLDYQVQQKDVGVPDRPIWVRDRETPGSTTDDPDVYSLGSVPANGVGSFRMEVVPLIRGRHPVSFTLDAGLYGKAKATFADGTPATFAKTIAIDPTINLEKESIVPR